MKGLVYKPEVLGQPVTSEIRSMTQKLPNPVFADTGFGHFCFLASGFLFLASDGAKTKFRQPAYSSRREESVSVVLMPRMIFG